MPHGRACGAFEGEYIRLNMSIPEGAKKLERLFCAAGASAEEMIKRIPEMAEVHFELTDDEIADFVFAHGECGELREFPVCHQPFGNGIDVPETLSR